MLRNEMDNKQNDLFGAEEVHQDDEETVWLLSYADLMTLLFTFFVMLYSSALLDDQETLRRNLSAYLANEVGFFKNGSGSGGTQANADSPSGEKDFSSTLKHLVEQKLKEDKILNDSQLLQTAEGVEITFATQILYDSGSEQIKDTSLASLKSVIDVILKNNKNVIVRVEGHTDERPINSSRFRSNWELSGARASSIISLFEELGFPPRNLVAIGYGSARPLLENKNTDGSWNEENMQKNRRVVLTILQPQTRPQEKK